MENVYETIEKRWDDNAYQYDATHDTDKNIDLWSAVIGRLLGEDRSKLVLDVGTGTGFISLIEAELGYRTFGLDLSTEMMRAGQQHAGETVQLVLKIAIQDHPGRAEEQHRYKVHQRHGNGHPLILLAILCISLPIRA